MSGIECSNGLRSNVLLRIKLISIVSKFILEFVSITYLIKLLFYKNNWFPVANTFLMDLHDDFNHSGADPRMSIGGVNIRFG